MRSPLLGLTCSQPPCNGLQLAISGDSTMSAEEFYENCILICSLAAAVEDASASVGVLCHQYMEQKTLPACKLSHSPKDNAAGQTMMRNNILTSQRSDGGRLCALHPCRHLTSPDRCAATWLCCLIMQSTAAP